MQFEELYSKYFPDVYRYALGLTKDSHTAEEITSETFYKALTAIDFFRGDCSLKVWLCRIAKNTYYSAMRKSRQLVPLDEDILSGLPDGQSNPEEYTVRREELARIRGCLHILENPFKEVFMWRVFTNMSFEEIGSLFDKSANWACVVYHRARKKIMEQLEESE